MSHRIIANTIYPMLHLYFLGILRNHSIERKKNASELMLCVLDIYQIRDDSLLTNLSYFVFKYHVMVFILTIS